MRKLKLDVAIIVVGKLIEIESKQSTYNGFSDHPWKAINYIKVDNHW